VNAEGLNLPLLLIFIVAPIGAIDVLYYHVYRFRLARRLESWAETSTHVVRSLILGLGTLLLVYQPAGLWFWFVAALFALDFVNSAVDAFLEQDSRASLGGLPRLEYVIHVIGATFMGAITVTFVIGGWQLAGLDTALDPRDVPMLMKLNAIAVSAGAFALAGYEAGVMLISAWRRTGGRAQSAVADMK
jgi:hypothetical protein